MLDCVIGSTMCMQRRWLSRTELVIVEWIQRGALPTYSKRSFASSLPWEKEGEVIACKRRSLLFQVIPILLDKVSSRSFNNWGSSILFCCVSSFPVFVGASLVSFEFVLKNCLHGTKKGCACLVPPVVLNERALERLLARLVRPSGQWGETLIKDRLSISCFSSLE